jgi:hypothetical protein
MNFFAPAGVDAAEYFEAIRVATPVGSPCQWCDEAIGEQDTGFLLPNPVHRECLVRMTTGSVSHQLRECACFGGTREDPPGLSRRQSALMAYEYFNIMRRK